MIKGETINYGRLNRVFPGLNQVGAGAVLAKKAQRFYGG